MKIREDIVWKCGKMKMGTRFEESSIIARNLTADRQALMGVMALKTPQATTADHKSGGRWSHKTVFCIFFHNLSVAKDDKSFVWQVFNWCYSK